MRLASFCLRVATCDPFDETKKLFGLIVGARMFMVAIGMPLCEESSCIAILNYRMPPF
jgi:hypothetical protein